MVNALELLGAVDVEVAFDGEDVGVGQVVVGAEFEHHGSDEVLGPYGIAFNREGAERFEVDEELSMVALAEGDQAGDGRGQVGGGYGCVGVVEASPCPSAWHGLPWSWGFGGYGSVPEDLEAGVGAELDGDRSGVEGGVVDREGEGGEFLAGPTHQRYVGRGQDGSFQVAGSAVGAVTAEGGVAPSASQQGEEESRRHRGGADDARVDRRAA